MEKIIPSLVSEYKIKEGSKDYELVNNGTGKAISLSLKDALYVSAIQEQQQQIEELKELLCLDHPEAEICKY